MPGEATILHADLDSFYASVEQRDDPQLRGRPVIVAGGVVLAASYEAKAYGVRTPMGCRAALALCPRAQVVPPRMFAYTEASRAVFELFADTTPHVEALSIDEAFLDAQGMENITGTPEQVAARLRRRVRSEVGLPITVGVASTKFLAKVASAVGKPDGLLVVPAGQELEFLSPLPVERLWGVGEKTARRLHEHGLLRVGDVAEAGEEALVSMLGPGAGRHLHALSQNRDPRRVRGRRRRRSMGSQCALGRRGRSSEELDTIVIGLVDRICRRLRAAGRVCRTVTLRLRFADFSRATRSHTMPERTAQTQVVLGVARDLLNASLPLIRRRGITLVGVALGNLSDDGAVQLALPFGRPGSSALDGAIDQIRERFGSSAITRAVLLGRDQGPVAPMLPD